MSETPTLKAKKLENDPELGQKFIIQNKPINGYKK